MLNSMKKCEEYVDIEDGGTCLHHLLKLFFPDVFSLWISCRLLQDLENH